MSLDKSRDYAIVLGDSVGACWSQDNLVFYEDGTVIEDYPYYDAKQKAAAAVRAGVKDAKDPEPDPDPDHVDLRAWGLGEVDAMFPKVRAQIKAEFGESPRNTVEAVAILVKQGVLTEADTKRA